MTETGLAHKIPDSPVTAWVEQLLVPTLSPGDVVIPDNSPATSLSQA